MMTCVYQRCLESYNFDDEELIDKDNIYAVSTDINSRYIMALENTKHKYCVENLKDLWTSKTKRITFSERQRFYVWKSSHSIQNFMDLKRQCYKCKSYKEIHDCRLRQRKTGEYYTLCSYCDNGKRNSLSKSGDQRIKTKNICTQFWKGPDYSGNCWMCDRVIEYDNFEVGHIHPIKYGGSNNMENLRAICSPCNKSIGDKNMYEVAESLLQRKLKISNSVYSELLQLRKIVNTEALSRVHNLDNDLSLFIREFEALGI